MRPPVGSQPARTDAAGEIDFDNDGSLSCDDCDDNDVANYPGGTEICDGQDNDCNGLADFAGGEADNDNDNFPVCADCDDTDANTYPAAPELCDGLDNDCDGTPDADLAGEIDFDNDGSLSCDDCDDDDGTVFPGAVEACNGQDDDCNGLADADAAGEIDFDNDGSLSCLDCDDNDGANYPGGTEICDGQDNDCNGLADFPGGEANCGGGAGYTGVYTLNQPITYSCLSGLYGWNFSTVSVVDSNPAIVVTAPTTPPGSMTGTFSSSTAFSASWTIGTLCVETYTFTGNFTSASTFSATFTSSFVGTCLDCVTNSWTVTGTL